MTSTHESWLSIHASYDIQLVFGDQYEPPRYHEQALMLSPWIVVYQMSVFWLNYPQAIFRESLGACAW